MLIGGHFQELSESAEIKTKRAIIAKTEKTIILHILDLSTEYEKKDKCEKTITRFSSSTLMYL